MAGPGAGASSALSAAEPQPEAVSLATMPALVWGLQRPALKLPPSRSGSDTCTHGGMSNQWYAWGHLQFSFHCYLLCSLRGTIF